MEPVELLDEKARVLHGEGAHPEPAFILGAADFVPSDEALSPADMLAGVPQEGAAQAVQGLDHRGRQVHGRHRVSGECIKHRIENG
jgi:hypothetical protein